MLLEFFKFFLFWKWFLNPWVETALQPIAGEADGKDSKDAKDAKKKPPKEPANFVTRIPGLREAKQKQNKIVSDGN